MRRSVWAIVAGLVLAIIGAAVVAKIFALPLVDLSDGEKPIWHIVRLALPIAAFAVPGALAAILLSEGFRVRGFFYWLSAGLILAVLAHITLTGGDNPRLAAFQSTYSFNTLLGMGVVGGVLYWMFAGYRAGHLASAMSVLGRATDLDERGLRKRCRSCTVALLALGLLPLSLVGWHAIYKPSPDLPQALTTQAAADGTKSLAEAGLPFASFKIDNHVGHITGVAPDDAQRTSGFEKAKSALAPMVGLPGVVAYLQNDLTVASPKPVEPQTPVADAGQKKSSVAAVDGVKKIKPEEELRLAMEAKKKSEAEAKAKAKEEERAAREAKKKADEEAAKAKEEARLAAEAKKKADDAAAKAKAEEEKRIAAEAKKKADDEAAAIAKAKEEERLALEAKKKADEAAAKARAEEEIRIAAAAKKKADDEAAAIAKAKEEERLALEAKKKADEAAAKARAEEEIRIAAEAKKKADEEAAKAKAAQIAAEARATEERLAAAREKQRIEDEKQLAADVAAQRKAAEEAKRRADEAAAEHKAVEAARATTTVAAADASLQPPAQANGQAPAPVANAQPVTVADKQCESDFSDTFRSVNVRFGASSSRLNASALEAIDRIAAVTKRCGAYSLAIGGHADRVGNDEENMRISLRRAEAVREALVGRGITSSRLKADGYGEQRPFDPANSRAAYRLNRRVDFGVRLTPAAEAKVAAAQPANATPVTVLPVEQCNAEFSRAFQGDTIRFIGASAIVSDSYADYLDLLARLALSCPTHVLQIGGHTDRRGSAAYNSALSQERAVAVRDALVDRDVPESRLSATGYGGERPFAPANTKAAYALNRRVDFGVAVHQPKSQ